jgi:D-alanine-D-alanine ligase
LKIVVLYGGVSTEREVSLKSGAAVEEGLARAGFETLLEDVTSIPALIERWPSFGADAAFVALHGGWGEDGRLQAALDAHNIPYTGSGPRSCRFAMDKETARGVMEMNGIPTPPGFSVTYDQSHNLADAVRNWGRIVVKPASGGSTVGVVISDTQSEARGGLIAVWDIDDKAIVEKYIPGREMTVAVFGNDADAFAMPVIEIRPRSGFYDYGSKYTAGASEYLCPAPVKDELADKIKDYARRAHTALGCRTYSRVDFRVTDDDEVYALEVNTAPGMTATSLVPKAACAHGWEFPELLRRIVEDCLPAR